MMYSDLYFYFSDSRIESPFIQTIVKFSAVSQESAFQIAPESVNFDFSLTVGIGEEDGPLVGGVKGKMVGRGAIPLLATAITK